MVVDCIWNDFLYVFMICFESIHNILFRLKGFIVPLNRPAVSLAFSILASSISSDSEAINQAQLSIPTSIGGRSSNDCVFSFAHTIYLTPSPPPTPLIPAPPTARKMIAAASTLRARGRAGPPRSKRRGPRRPLRSAATSLPRQLVDPSRKLAAQPIVSVD